MRTVKELVDSTISTSGLLPLVHVAAAFDFPSIVDSGSLIPFKCDVFHESLLYFFHGRPAYKTRQTDNPNLLFDFPIVFALRPDSITDNVRRVFPLDSGAFSNGLFSRYFHKRTTLADLALTSSLESVGKCVSLFYVSNTDYYTGRSTKNVNIGPLEFAAQGLHELARLPGPPSDHPTIPIDERSSSIEVQVNVPIPLRDNVVAIVMPNAILDDENVRRRLAEIAPTAEIVTYHVMHGLGPSGMASVIYQKLYDTYEAMGLF